MTSVTAHLIGTPLVVKTTSGDAFKGDLFCYDIIDSNSFVLQEHLGKARVNYHWIKCSAVKDIQAISLSTLNIETAGPPSIDVRTLDAQSRRASESFQSYKDSIGVGVTEEAQELFDSLSKTMPCSWNGSLIQVYRVKISSPYTLNECDGPDENELSRVKKVLDGERLKLDAKRLQQKQ